MKQFITITRKQRLYFVSDCSRTFRRNYWCGYIAYIGEKPYLQIDFSKAYTLTAIATKQRGRKKWFTEVKLKAGIIWLNVPSGKVRVIIPDKTI